MMRKLTKLEKFGLITAILVSGTYFYMNRVYDPQAETLKRTVNKLNSTLQSYSQIQELPPLETVQRMISDREETLTQLKQALTAAGGRIGEVDEVTPLLDKISALARDTQMVILSLTPQESVAEELYVWDVFDLRLVGSFPALVDFLEQLKEMPEPVQVRNLELEKADVGSGGVLVSTRLLF